MKAVQELSLTCSAVIVLVLAPSVLKGVLFPWHPLLMVLGFLGCMTDGIMGAYALRSLVGEKRVAGLRFHGYVQTAAALLAGLGFLAIFNNKNRLGKPHFTTLHGQLGLGVLACTLLSLALGACSFREYGIITRFPLAWQGRIKRAHRLFSTLTWLLALAEMQLVLPHPAVLQGIWCRLWQAGVALVAMCVLAALYLAGSKSGGSSAAAPQQAVASLRPPAMRTRK